MDEAMEPQSIVPKELEEHVKEVGFSDDRLLLYQIKAIEAQTRELAHIGDALYMISGHLAWVAQKAIADGRLQPPPPGFEEGEA